MNEQLLISSVRQHELTEKAEKAESLLRLSDERFRLALSSGAVTVYEQDKELRYKWVYPEAPNRADVVGKTDEDLSLGPYADELNALKRRVLETGERQRGEVAADVKGIRHWYDLLLEPRKDQAGNITGIGGTTLDITERKNAELLLETQRQALEMVVSGRSLTEVLEFLVGIVEDRSEDSSVGAIMLIDDEGKLHNAASRNLPQAYLDAIDGIAADESVGTCSAAAATSKTVITPDIAADPKWKDFGHLPLGLGLPAAWSMPIITVDGRVLGTFGTYFREKREPTDLERRTVEILSNTAALAIERKRTEDKFAEQKTLLEGLTESVLDGILIVAPSGQMIHYNQQFLDIWNFPPEIVESRSDRAALAWAAEQTTDPGAFLGRVDHIYSQPDIQFREEMWMKDGRVYERFGAPVAHGETRLGWVWTFRDISEQKRSGELISESEQRMRLAMTAANMYSWEIDVASRKTIIAKDAAQVLGFARNEQPTAVESQISTVVHPDDRDRVGDALDKAFVTGEFHEQMRLIAPETGQVVWAETSGTARYDETGKPVKLFGVTQNITERKYAEDSLRESENRLRTMANSIPHLAWMAEPDGSIFWFNNRWHEYTGTTAEQMMDGGWKSVHDPKMLPKVVEAWLKSIETGEPFDMEFPLRGADGSFRWFLTRVFPLRDDEGKIVRWFGTNTDIEESRLIREALRESEERFAKAFNSSPLSITITSLETGKLVEVNDTFIGITGFTREEAVGKTTYELGLWSEPTDREAELETVMSDGRLREHEYRFRMKDGSEIIGLLSAELIDIGGERCALTVIQDITERSRADLALRESEERFVRFMQYLPGLAWIKDVEGRYVYANDAAMTVFRSTKEQLYGKTDEEVFSPEIARQFRANDDLAINRRSGVQTIEKLEHEDGRLHHSIVNKFPILDPEGRTGLIGGMAIDVTDRIRAEEALRDSEKRFHLLANNISQLAWMMDPKGFIYWYNERWFEFTGTNLEEMQSWGWQKAQHPDEVERVVEKFKRHIASGETWEDTFQIRSKTGEYRWFLSRALPVRDADGQIIHWFGTNTDITDRREAEEALRKSEERRHLAQNAGKVGVWDWNIAEGKTYWSDTMWELYGEERRDINPDESFWSSHLHPNDHERVKQNLRQVVLSQNDEFRDEYRIVNSDGSIRWVDAKGQVLRDASGAAIRMYGVNMDISERKDSEERIKLSENQLRLITNALPALISYVDNNERFRFVNQKFTEWFDISSEEMVGLKVREVFGTPAYRVLKPQIDKALSGQQCTFETAINYKNAGKRYIHISYMPDMGVDGIVYGYYGLTHDLTDLQLSRDLLRSSEERMALMVDSVADYAIFSMDSEGTIDTWNHGAELIYGYSHNEIVGQSSEIIFTPDDVERGIHTREMRLARKKGRASSERWHLRKDGTQFYASGVTMPLYLGKVLSGYAKIVSDLTEKQRQAENLRRAHDELDLRVRERTRELAESNLALVQEMEVREVSERQRVDLLGRLVTSQEFERRRIARDLHDQLGQRLTALRLEIASLKDFTAGNDVISSRVERLQEIAERLDSEVSFLAWELRPTALDDLGLVDAVGAFVNEWARHSEIAADFHSTGLTKARLNHDTETHLYRITQEALNNIAKHADAKHVSVLLEKREDSVTLIIEDNGAGFNINSKRVSNESGGGLGLVGMSERASLIGGNVVIESAPGKGTTIFVRVPFSG